MRFSQDQQFFDDIQKPQQQSDKPVKTPKKKEKKQTMLSKFLDSITSDMMKKLLNYQKLKRPVFERRNIVPHNITLYEDILFITIFKQNQSKINEDSKHIKSLCLDLESRTKRKQCTIKQRIQKKLCKMNPMQIMDYVSKDKDISFKKESSSSNSKIPSSTNHIDAESMSIKQEERSLKTEQKYISQFLQNQDEKSNKELKNTQDDEMIQNSQEKNKKQEIYEEQQQDDQKVTPSKQKMDMQQNQQNQNQMTNEIQNLDQTILIVNKKQTQNEPFIFNIQLVERQIERLREQQRKIDQREQLMKVLKQQLEVIQKFKAQKKQLNPQVKKLILEAQKITRMLGLVDQSDNNNQTDQNPETQEYKDVKEDENIQYQKQQNTSEKNFLQPDGQSQNQALKPHVSQFNNKMEQEKQTISKSSNNNLQYSLCENEQYIKLYKSDPVTFEPLLWAQDEDQLIDNLIQNFQSHQYLFKMLIRYKGPEMFVERCCFLKKNIKLDSNLYMALKAYKPLNMNKLSNLILQQQMQQNSPVSIKSVQITAKDDMMIKKREEIQA